MRRRPPRPSRRVRAGTLASIVASLALLGCNSENTVSVATSPETSTETGADTSTDTVTSSTEIVDTTIGPATTVVAPSTTEKRTGSRLPDECVPPQQFRDIDGDGLGVCFRPDGAPQAPAGDSIVDVPGSTTIVRQGVNATIEIEGCRGNGIAGTIEVVGELINVGGTIDRGSINLHMLDADGVLATVAARVAAVASGASVQLDFQTAADDSAARTIGDVQVCWFDSIQDVTFFTGL